MGAGPALRPCVSSVAVSLQAIAPALQPFQSREPAASVMRACEPSAQVAEARGC